VGLHFLLPIVKQDAQGPLLNLAKTLYPFKLEYNSEWVLMQACDQKGGVCL